MIRMLYRSVSALAVFIACTTTAHANAVTDWNAATNQSVATGRPGPIGLLDLAIVQAAVHDAVQAIEGDYNPYYYSNAQQHGVGNPDAAVASASHRMLVLLYPGQQPALDTFYDNYLASNGLTGNSGLAVGEAAAASLFTQYRPPNPPAAFFGVSEPGQWRSVVPMGFLQLAFTEPFTLNRADQFRPQPPPPMASQQYVREYNEVKAAGKSTAHPNANTEVARFWSVNFVAQWNEAARGMAVSEDLDTGKSARLFALLNLAAADAAIAVWDSKFHYNFWRPSTAIQEGALDGNPRTDGDAAWAPLLGNPPYPDYVSGANGLTGAFTGMLQDFFGTDQLNYSVRTTSPFVLDNERDYTSFSQAAQEVVDARIYLGIHFRSADEEGRRLGDRVAHWTYQKFLRPVPGSGQP
jgi:hypothetical protein